MKNSTILFVFGLLGLSGVGVYLYLKNKKAPNTTETPPSSTNPPSSATPPISATSTNPTTSGSTSVVDNSLGLPLPTDKIVALYNETQTENYKKAKLLSNEIQKDYARINQYKRTKTKDAVRSDIARKTAEANALGYKILDFGEIEKM
jgi:flagellar basal body-associated protein FliL